MTNSNKLFRWWDPYDTLGTEALFAAAMEENARFQEKNCPDYGRILREQGKPDLGARQPPANPHPVFQAPRPLLPAREQNADQSHLLRYQRRHEPHGL